MTTASEPQASTSAPAPEPVTESAPGWAHQEAAGLRAPPAWSSSARSGDVGEVGEVGEVGDSPGEVDSVGDVVSVVVSVVVGVVVVVVVRRWTSVRGTQV